MKLSAYTKATNCTDLTDCQYGLDELFAILTTNQNLGKTTPAYVTIRFSKLMAKKRKLQAKFN